MVMDKDKLNEYHMKPVNPDYYEEIKLTLTGDPDAPAKELTREEFQRGEPGIVWMDNETGNLIFKEDGTT